MNTLQSQQIHDLVKAIQEKGGVEDVNVTEVSPQPNGCVIVKIEQYFHFFPTGIDKKEEP